MPSYVYSTLLLLLLLFLLRRMRFRLLLLLLLLHMVPRAAVGDGGQLSLHGTSEEEGGTLWLWAPTGSKYCHILIVHPRNVQLSHITKEYIKEYLLFETTII